MKKYYVGFNGTNVICNDEYFNGYITAYPLGEKNNISYFDKADTQEELNKEEFKVWARKQMLEILKTDPHAQFTFFNKGMADICSVLPDQNIQAHNDWSLLEFLNDKFKIRKHLQDNGNVGMLDYLYLKGLNINYSDLQGKLGTEKFVIQSHTGSGGLTTHSINSAKDIDNLSLNNDEVYSVSGYQENLPINATIMVAEKDLYQLPISVQLIKNTGNFIYCGGDFVMPQSFDKKVTEQITEYNGIIGKELQKLGYKGICGIDYIVYPNGMVKFMELNPRYQGSSFLLSLALKNANTSIARLNAECFSKDQITKHNISMNSSFVNCKKDSDFAILGEPNNTIKKVNNATFRKIYNRSICLEDNFEKPYDLSSICCM